MSLWRVLASAAIIIFATRTASAQTYSLSETPKAGDCFRIHLEMTLRGEIRISGEAKPSSLPLQARAEHDFPERILVVNSKGLPEKSARLYETAKAAIRVGGDRTEHTLRPDRRPQVAPNHNSAALHTPPAAPPHR